MKGIIWYINNDAGLYELDNIKNNYQRKGINFLQAKTYSRSKKNKDEYIIFENGDEWRTCYASDSARGNCCNISLIEKNISKRIIDTIIVPCTKALPYTAFKYYNFDEYSLYEQLL